MFRRQGQDTVGKGTGTGNSSKTDRALLRKGTGYYWERE